MLYVVIQKRKFKRNLLELQMSKKPVAMQVIKDFTGNSELEQQVKLYDYSVSNRGLRPNLIGTPEQIAERIIEFEKVGVDLLLLQFSPQLEEMERFSRDVMPLVERKVQLVIK